MSETSELKAARHNIRRTQAHLAQASFELQQAIHGLLPASPEAESEQLVVPSGPHEDRIIFYGEIALEIESLAKKLNKRRF